MSIDKLAVWVHPLWSTRDLGEDIVKFWQQNISEFAQDTSYGFVLTGCPEDSVHNDAWASRVLPIIHSLPDIFGERYIKWQENYIEGNNPEHTMKLIRKFGMSEVEFHKLGYPLPYIFKEARVDGLIPGPQYCPAEQRRELRRLTPLFDIYSWKHFNNSPKSTYPTLKE